MVPARHGGSGRVVVSGARQWQVAADLVRAGWRGVLHDPDCELAPAESEWVPRGTLYESVDPPPLHSCAANMVIDRDSGDGRCAVCGLPLLEGEAGTCAHCA